MFDWLLDRFEENQLSNWSKNDNKFKAYWLGIGFSLAQSIMDYIHHRIVLEERDQALSEDRAKKEAVESQEGGDVEEKDTNPLASKLRG